MSLLCGGVMMIALGAVSAHAQAALPISLSQAVAIARDTAAASDIARLRENEAVARVGQARAVLLPSLTGTSSYSNRTYNIFALGIPLGGFPAFPALIGPVTSFDARFTLSETLFDPSNWAKIGAARRGVDVARADAGATDEQTAQSAALAYLRAARARATVDARAADSVLALDLLQLAQAQEKAGTTPTIETTRAHSQVVAAEGALVMARNQFDRAMVDLSRALGLDPARRLALTDTLSAELATSDAPEQADAATTFALEHRPDLLLERARAVRARADRSAISWERLGKIQAEADYGASGLQPSDAIGTRQYAVAWNVPLIDGFRREQRIAEQNAVISESQVRERDIRSQIAAEVTSALLDLASGREQQRVAADRMRLAEDELREAQARFRGGVAGSLELANAQESMLRARDAEIDARYTIAAARVAVARAAGVAVGLH